MPYMTQEKLSEYYKIVRSSSLYQHFYEDYSDYKKAPLLDKNVLTHLLDTHFNLQQESTGLYLVRSGGSTQKPLVFPVDITENLEQRSVLAKALSADGIFSPKTIAMNLFSYMDMYRTAAILDDILEKCMATTLALSSSVKYEDAYDAALHFQPDFILGTPSKLFLFAQYLKNQEKTIAIPNLLFGGEFILPSTIPLFKAWLGVQNIYSIYGSAETGIWAWSDYTHQPSLFKIIEGMVIEIDQPDADGYGGILVSNLFRKRFPIFRYYTGDIGRLIQKEDQTLLELKSREKKSFFLYESNYTLEDFNEVLLDLTTFQIQLLPNQELGVSLRFLMITDISPLERPGFEQQKKLQIEAILGYELNSLEVLAAPELELHTNPVTGKTPFIIDFRI